MENPGPPRRGLPEASLCITPSPFPALRHYRHRRVRQSDSFGLVNSTGAHSRPPLGSLSGLMNTKLSRLHPGPLWRSPNMTQELIRFYGLWILFVGIMLECLGLPLPGETVLISVALYAGSTNELAIGSVLSSESNCKAMDVPILPMFPHCLRARKGLRNWAVVAVWNWAKNVAKRLSTAHGHSAARSGADQQRCTRNTAAPPPPLARAAGLGKAAPPRCKPWRAT
jgi:hypothetical protein